MPSLSAWLVTFRLRTLPLSLSTIILGSFLAAFHYSFSWSVFIWAALTTLFLQILSNLANDYGDAINGVDNHGRVGPKRSLQTGAITLVQMKIAIVVFVILSLASGVILLIEGMKGLRFSYGLIMFIVGLLAIAAALKYTIGKNPYGYAGFGDVAVFLFFGIVGVMGTYYLHTHTITPPEFLPAMSIGFFSTGVLNLNNLRDRDNDRAFGKKTMVVKLGLERAKSYHSSLIISGLLAAIAYSIVYYHSIWQFVYVLTFPLFISSIVSVIKNKQPHLLDPELRKLALTTLAFSILFGWGLLW